MVTVTASQILFASVSAHHVPPGEHGKNFLDRLSFTCSFGKTSVANPKKRLHLFRFRSPDAEIGSPQSECLCHRAGRAETSFFVECAGRRFSRHTEEALIICPHAFIVGRACCADTPCPVLCNDGSLIPGHNIRFPFSDYIFMYSSPRPSNPFMSPYYLQYRRSLIMNSCFMVNRNFH